MALANSAAVSRVNDHIPMLIVAEQLSPKACTIGSPQRSRKSRGYSRRLSA